MKRELQAILLACLLLPRPAAAEQVRVAYNVFCDDRAVAARISLAIEQEMKKSPDYKLVDKLPAAKLLLYVNKDINNRNNPEGWSIAIAHVSNLESIYLASKLINSTQPEIMAVKSVLIGMINEDGFIKHFSVAHLDEMSESEIGTLSRSVVPTFYEKISAYTKPSN